MDCTVSDKMDKMKHMQITSLNKKRFGHLLQSIFNVRLARWEVSALMDYFDDDGSGCLDFVEFKQLLFKLVDRGRAEQREKVKRDNDRARERVRGLGEGVG